MKAKILSADEVQVEVGKAIYYAMPIVLATGCFDILHRGHVELLEGARFQFPGHAVWVGLNSDAAVRELKGDGRPVHDYESRAIVMAGLQAVDHVFEIPSVRVTGALTMIRPRVWVKGGDYTLETLDASEREAAQACKTIIHIVPTIAGYSTSKILSRL